MAQAQMLACAACGVATAAEVATQHDTTLPPRPVPCVRRMPNSQSTNNSSSWQHIHECARQDKRMQGCTCKQPYLGVQSPAAATSPEGTRPLQQTRSASLAQLHHRTLLDSQQTPEAVSSKTDRQMQHHCFGEFRSTRLERCWICMCANFSVACEESWSPCFMFSAPKFGPASVGGRPEIKTASNATPRVTLQNRVQPGAWHIQQRHSTRTCPIVVAML